MMRKLAAFLFALLLATPCAAALSVVTIGMHHMTTGTTNVLTTTTNDCPVGSLIVVTAGYVTVADTLSSVIDSAGNTWATPFDNIAGTGIGIGWAYAVNTANDLPIGGTITATFGGSVATQLNAVCISGAATAAPLDVASQSANGASATSATTVNSGTLSQANEILIGGFVSATASNTVTCGGSYTRINTASGTPSGTMCTQIVSSTSSVSFAPTWVTSANYVTDLVSFKAAPTGGGNVPPALLTVGAGP